MLTAIIVDDEKKVCHLIQNLIDWKKIGVIIIGIANNGKTAYDLIYEKDPDIVITDIRMPGFDGIELITNIQKAGLSPHFIIISGYRNFEYAHMAIKYGVEEYLLKPIKKEELKSIIIKIKEKINNSSKNNEHHIINYTIFNSQKTLDIIERDININHKNIFKSNKEKSRAIFIKIDTGQNKDNRLINNMLNKITKIIEESYDDRGNDILCYILHYGVICIINKKSDQNNLEIIFERTKEYLDLFEDYTLTLGVGNPVLNINEISNSIQQAIDSVIFRIKLGTNKIISLNHINYQNDNFRDIMSAEQENDLINAFETLDQDSIRKKLTEIFNNYKSQRFLSPLIIIELAKKLTNEFFIIIKKFGLEPKNERQFRDAISTGIDRALSINEIYNTLLKSMYKQIDLINNLKKNEDNKPIREAKRYIRKHYMEKLTLTDVAEIVNLSSDYLSSIFKKEVGINFSNYIINYRLDKAKKLLVNTDKTISYISDEIGYRDSRYFSKLFKNRIGIKPSEYRNLYS